MSKKYGFQSPVYRKASAAEIVGSIVINLAITISATALGIKMYNKKNQDKGGNK